MPDSFCEESTGLLYVVNGQDTPVYWDGVLPSFRDSGVIAPTPQITLAGSGSGDISGRLYAMIRYVDDRGNYSNVSPVSALATIRSAGLTITDCSYESPIVVTVDVAHGLITDDYVVIEGVDGSTDANGYWQVTVVSPTTFSLNLSSANSPYTGGGTVYTGVATLTYSGLPTPTQSKVVRRQILRNKDGDATVFYVDIDTTDLSSTQLSSTNTQLDLDVAVPVDDAAGTDLIAARFTPMPDYKSLLSSFKGRMFLWGDEDDTTGNVGVIQGAATVTGLNTHFRDGYIGRYLSVPGAGKVYEILSVESETAMTLTAPYQGTTVAYTPYAVQTADVERRTLYFSEAGKSEAWPPENSRVLNEDPGAGKASASCALNNWLYLLCESRAYRFSFGSDPRFDSAVTTASSRGAINNRCKVLVEGVLYLLDRQGIHALDGNNDDPTFGAAVEDVFSTNPTGNYAIQWDKSNTFHAVYNPSEQELHWFVCLDGSSRPRHSLSVSLTNGRWWIQEYPFEIGASCTGLINGRAKVFLGTKGCRILTLDGVLDGPIPSAGTTRGTVTSAGMNWIRDTTAVFPSSGVVNFPVSIVAGRGKGQRRIVLAQVTTRLTVDRPWAVMPDTTSVYQLGAIDWVWQSLWYHLTEAKDESARGFSVQFKPQVSAGRLAMQQLYDFGAASTYSHTTLSGDGNGISTKSGENVAECDLTRGTGYVTMSVDSFRQVRVDGRRHVSLRLVGSGGADRTVIYRIRLDGVD